MADKPRVQHTNQDLELAAERYLPYEITQLVGIAQLLSGTVVVSAPIHTGRILNNALLEAFLIHLRSLDDFLGKKTHGKEGSDVLAIDLLPSWKPKRFLDASLRQAVNDQLAHLTVHRVPGSQHPWQVINLAFQAINALDDEFLPALRAAGDSQSNQWLEAVEPSIDWARAMIEEMPTDLQFST